MSIARLAREHDRIRDALAGGSIRSQHVGSLARAAHDREELFAEHVDTLVDHAERFPAEIFRIVVRRWRALADDHADHDPVRPASGLNASITWGGRVRLDGELEPDDGAVVLDAIARVLAPPSPDDRRTPAQRRAAALVDALLQGRATATVDVVIDLRTLVGEAPGDVSRAWHDATHVGPIPSWLAQRYACDATIRRVVFAPDGEVLDLGRATRVVSPALRRALERRDRHCTWPGCDRPPAWCDAHHVRAWTTHGGPTDLDNLVLLCRHHHRLTHQRMAPPHAPPAVAA